MQLMGTTQHLEEKLGSDYLHVTGTSKVTDQYVSRQGCRRVTTLTLGRSPKEIMDLTIFS